LKCPPGTDLHRAKTDGRVDDVWLDQHGSHLWISFGSDGRRGDRGLRGLFKLRLLPPATSCLKRVQNLPE
jgi:hypothetical protein